MSFRPYPTRSGLIALTLTTICAVAAIFLVNQLLLQNNPLKIFTYSIWILLAVSLTGLAGYWAFIVFRLNYHLNRNGISIQWGLGRQLIPFKAIEQIISGQHLQSLQPNVKAINIAGLRVGQIQHTDYGQLTFRNTAPLEQSLLIVTNQQAFMISPRQPQAFIEAWQVRRELGPTQNWTTHIQRNWPLNLPLLADPLTWWLLGLAAVLCFALFGYIAWRYADLPIALPVHFNNLGRADRIAGKIVLFSLPAAGALVWLINGVLGILAYAREKIAAYFLWGSTITMQLCLWVATLTITA